MQIVLIWLIKGYRYFLSPWIGMHCRFHPTCSCYAIEAIERFGAIKGSWLMITRLIRCHPFCEGGFDPVPDKPNIDNARANPPLSQCEKYDRICACTKCNIKK